MKRILKTLSIIMIIILFSGCSSKIKKISYTDFNEYFSNKTNFDIVDKTSEYDIDVRRYIEVGEGNYQIFYIEFDNEKTADKYIDNMYKNDKNVKIKVKKDYTYIKSNKKDYLRLYKKDNVIVYGTTKNKKYKRQMKKVLKDLGY
ncbi:MAG: hypothetical protein IJ105_03525 [Bacilli bacterium]|nr:hypothetical protein [Bacilli bacterium]